MRVPHTHRPTDRWRHRRACVRVHFRISDDLSMLSICSTSFTFYFTRRSLFSSFFFLNFDPRSDEDRWKHFRARETIRRWTLHNKLQSLSWRSVLKQSFRCQNSFSCQVLSGKSKLQTFSGISMEKCYAKRGRARGGRLFVCWLMERSSREFPSTPAFRLLC